MSIPVAESLSSIQTLLAYPPQYPRNPTHRVRKALTLYIVRVPGSKDVFLTPLKPPTKASISLEAIQSSLYYFHVNTTQDEHLRASLDEQNVGQPVESTVPSVQRKPLPEVPFANYPPSQRPTPPPKGYPHLQLGPQGRIDATQQERYLSRGEHVNFDHAADSTIGTVKRKPLGPRKLPSTESDHGHRLQRKPITGVEDSLTPDTFSSDLVSDQEQGSIHAVDAPLYAQQNEPSRLPIEPKRSVSPARRQVNEMSTSSDPAGHVSITIIRRDPASGTQWNVGSISHFSANSAENLGPATIELTAPGYGRFIHNSNRLAPGAFGNDAKFIKKMIAAAGEESEVTLQEIGRVSNDTPGFQRTITYRTPPPFSRVSLISRRNNSQEAANVINLKHSMSNKYKPPQQVYAFESPWQGFCSFSNAIDGRSLKCRHALPSSNPQEEGTTVTVAEVRFNLAWHLLGPKNSDKGRFDGTEAETLPISELIREKKGKETIKRGVKHIKAFSRDLRDRRFGADSSAADDDDDDDHGTVPPLPPRPPRPSDSFDGTSAANGSEDDYDTVPPLPPRPSYPSEFRTAAANESEEDHDEDVERLSLKLGREKAGGGFKGNSAKLGKIILEDEGLKMGDLVVSACMAVWWQHYSGSVGIGNGS